MSNTTAATSAIAADITQEAYYSFVVFSILFSAITLAFYTTLITISREQEYMWSRPFSFPTLLYIFTRYGNLIYQGFVLLIAFTPPGRSCDILAVFQQISFLSAYIGIQGLLATRAYSMCNGNKIISSILAFGLLSYMGLQVYSLIAFPGCSPGTSFQTNILNLIIDIITVCIDSFLFSICMWKIWEIWRLKRSTGIQGSNSLISVLLRQSILRFCFVITFTITNVVLVWFKNAIPPLFENCFALMQNDLSAILVADLTLDLRHFNSARIEASQMSLPPLKFSNVLHHIHRSFLVEMATPEEYNIAEHHTG